MSKIVQCLKLMSKTTNQFDLAKKLEIDWLKMLELIGKINQIEPGLINTSSGSGFFLTHKLDWINATDVLKNLAAKQLSSYTVKILPETISTNTYVLNNIGKLQDRTVVTTEFQSQGRGRGDKQWISKIATDLTVSLLYFFEHDFDYQLLPLVAAVGINRLLKQYRLQNFIKWPNDIHLMDKSKIAGILLESGIRDKKRFVVIGIGLDNLLRVDRSELLCNLINHMDHVVKEYSVFGFAMFRREWLDNCLHYNEAVNLYQNGQLIDSGINIDLTEDGQLVIKSKNQEKQYVSNNISLRVDGMK